jgi:hypothetical protein
VWVTISFCAILLGALAYDWVFLPIRWRRDYFQDWQKHKAGAFEPTRRPIGDNPRHYELRRVADEWLSPSGRRAITLHHRSGSGIVVQEINSDGSFSKKGPYYVKLRPFIWQKTGLRHVVDVEVAPGAFKTTNPSGGYSRERGVRVVQFNTSHYAPLSFREYSRAMDRTRSANANRRGSA